MCPGLPMPVRMTLPVAAAMVLTASENAAPSAPSPWCGSPSQAPRAPGARWRRCAWRTGRRWSVPKSWLAVYHPAAQLENRPLDRGPRNTRRSARSNASAGKTQLAQFLLEARSKVAAIERESEVGGQESEPRPAIIGSSVKADAVKRLGSGELDHPVGELDFAPGALLDQLQDREDLRLEDVAPRNDKIGRRRPGLRLPIMRVISKVAP